MNKVTEPRKGSGSARAHEGPEGGGGPSPGDPPHSEVLTHVPIHSVPFLFVFEAPSVTHFLPTHPLPRKKTQKDELLMIFKPCQALL